MVMLIMMKKMMKHCCYNPLLNEDAQINSFDKNKMMHFQGYKNNLKRNSYFSFSIQTTIHILFILMQNFEKDFILMGSQI